MVADPTPQDEIPAALRPGEAVTARLAAGCEAHHQGRTAEAARLYAAAVALAQAHSDAPGEARSLAQLAALEESCGEIDAALTHNAAAIERFLALGDGAGLVQAHRLDAFLHLRQGDVNAAAAAFARALALALQIDTRLVLTTLNQILPAARHLIERDQLPALLPMGAAIQQAMDSVERARGSWPAEMADVAEIARTVGGVLPPLAVMAEEPDLPAEKRRALAARATHQAWLVDALTRRRWALADLVDKTLKTKLDFHEKLD